MVGVGDKCMANQWLFCAKVPDTNYISPTFVCEVREIDNERDVAVCWCGEKIGEVELVYSKLKLFSDLRN